VWGSLRRSDAERERFRCSSLGSPCMMPHGSHVISLAAPYRMPYVCPSSMLALYVPEESTAPLAPHLRGLHNPHGHQGSGADRLHLRYGRIALGRADIRADYSMGFLRHGGDVVFVTLSHPKHETEWSRAGGTPGCAGCMAGCQGGCGAQTRKFGCQ